MKHFIPGAALLLLAGLCGSTAKADPVYNASVTIVAPTNGATYTAHYPQTSYSVPYSITNQFVGVTGAAPSTMITVSWQMTDGLGNGGMGIGIATDYSQPQPVMTNTSGAWKRFVNNNGTGSLSGSYNASPGNYSISANSKIVEANGMSHSISFTNAFTVVVVQ